MYQYISLLRGINVSGQKKIIMSELCLLFQELGFNDVKTYIQSGNVVFNSPESDGSLLEQQIRASILNKFTLDVPVSVISAAEFSQIVKQQPFDSVNIDQDGSKILVSFLSTLPEPSAIDDLLSFVVEPEMLYLNNKTVYLYCPNGYGKSKLSNVFLEKKLKVLATTRNLNTVNKLNQLAKSY